MSKLLLITGSETLLGRKVVEKALKLGYNIIAPVASKASSNAENNREDLLVLPWNRASVFSAKTVIREAERKMGPIERALFLSPASAEQNYLSEMSVAQIDDHIDNTLRGLSYLLRELFLHQQNLDNATLCFARTQLKNNLALQKGSLGFFQSLADSIIQENHGNLSMCGFLSDSPDMDGYADFILQYLESLPEKAQGQWLKHSDKKNLFSQLPIEKRVG